jgi:hypothetical protein
MTDDHADIGAAAERLGEVRFRPDGLRTKRERYRVAVP